MNVLWDFDGTIFDTYPAYTEIFKEIVGKEVQVSEILTMLKISFSHAIKFYQLSEMQEQQIRDKSAEIKPECLSPFPYIEKVLRDCKTNVIMTHKNRNEVEYILDYHNFSQYFTEIVAGDDGYPRKPDPASYHYLHEKYQLDLAVGDRALDVIPAKFIGIKTCLFQNRKAYADFYLDDYQEFSTLVQPKI